MKQAQKVAWAWTTVLAAGAGMAFAACAHAQPEPPAPDAQREPAPEKMGPEKMKERLEQALRETEQAQEKLRAALDRLGKGADPATVRRDLDMPVLKMLLFRDGQGARLGGPMGPDGEGGPMGRARDRMREGPEERRPEGRGPDARGPADRGPDDHGPEGPGPGDRGRPEGRGPDGRGGQGPNEPMHGDGLRGPGERRAEGGGGRRFGPDQASRPMGPDRLDRPEGGPRGGGDFGPEERQRLMGAIERDLPDFAARVKEVREKHPQLADRMFQRLAPRVRDILSVREQDPELFKLRLEELKGGLTVLECIHAYRQAMLLDDHAADTPAKRTEAEKALRDAVAVTFDQRLKLDEHEATRVSDRLNDIRAEIEKKRTDKEKAVDDIVKRIGRGEMPPP